MMLACATFPGATLPKSHWIVKLGAPNKGEQDPWLALAETNSTPPGSWSLTTQLWERRGKLLYAVIRKSMRVPTGIAFVGLGWIDLEIPIGLPPCCAEADLVVACPTTTASTTATTTANTTAANRLAFGPTRSMAICPPPPRSPAREPRRAARRKSPAMHAPTTSSVPAAAGIRSEGPPVSASSSVPPEAYWYCWAYCANGARVPSSAVPPPVSSQATPSPSASCP